MNYKINRILSMILVGAALASAPFMARAQESVSPESGAVVVPGPTQQDIRNARINELRNLRDRETSERAALRALVHADEFSENADIRAGETALGQVDRAIQNSARAEQIRDFRRDERGDRIDNRFTRDVFMILNSRINQFAELDARAELAADRALKYGGFCTTDASGKRTCVQGTENQKELQARAEATAVRRDAQQELQQTLAEERVTDSEVRRDIREAETEANSSNRETTQKSRISEANNVRKQEASAEKAIYDRRIEKNKGIVAARKDNGGSVGEAETIGEAVFNFGSNLVRFPSLFYIMSYVCGVYFMAMGLIKANRSAIEPSRNPISDAVKYMGAGVFLAALPVTTSVIQRSLGFKPGQNVLELDYEGLKAASEATKTDGAKGLDQFLVNLVTDITAPLLSVVVMIAMAMGVFLLFQGLQRLVKGSQEGPKGPAGLGTIMNFVIGAALLSFIPTFELVLNSTFGTPDIMTHPQMSAIAGGIGVEEANLAQAKLVITALLAFLGIIGVISFARGLFMLKDAADGAQNASLMGSMSHIIAGVCCVNFGAFANLLQNTLGLDKFGVLFN